MNAIQEPAAVSSETVEHPSWCDRTQCTYDGEEGAHQSAARLVEVGGIEGCNDITGVRFRQWQTGPIGGVESPIFTEVAIRESKPWDRWTVLFDVDPDNLPALQAIVAGLLGGAR